MSWVCGPIEISLILLSLIIRFSIFHRCMERYALALSGLKNPLGNRAGVGSLAAPAKRAEAQHCLFVW